MALMEQSRTSPDVDVLHTNTLPSLSGNEIRIMKSFEFRVRGTQKGAWGLVDWTKVMEMRKMTAHSTSPRRVSGDQVLRPRDLPMYPCASPPSPLPNLHTIRKRN